MSLHTVQNEIEVLPSTKGDGVIIIINGETAQKHFSRMISRGMNTWDQAPPVMKEFADLYQSGEILQDYRSQDTSPK